MNNPLNPCYIIEENKLRQNLSLIQSVAQESETEIILAFKAFANWKTFPIFREYITHSTASSPYEARLAYEEFGSRAYTYSPAYEENTFEEIMHCSEHITFNSLSQYERFKHTIKKWNLNPNHHKISIGLRINPEYSEIETDLYNPCAPGSRFGVKAPHLESLPEGIEGLHFHCLCENDSTSLTNTLKHVEEKFGKILDQIKWLNMGGGHLMTREGYHIDNLIQTLKSLKVKHPKLKLILEPGSAFLWKTGYLTSKVIDIINSENIKTAILNVSFTCHMPDCLEMPYQPAVRNALIYSGETNKEEIIYRLGGNSCLSGDFIGSWIFPKPLKIGDEIIFEDMIHYTTVKTNMFNGIHHPSIAIKHLNGDVEILKEFGYEDYKNRMD